MKRTKRILALVLTALLAMGAWTVFAGAQTADEQTAVFTTTVSADTVAPGETVTVTVSGTTNYYAAVIGLALRYDAALFDLVPDSLELADVYGAGTTLKSANTETAGLVYAIFVPDITVGTQAAVLDGTVLFTFKLTAKAEGACAVGMDASELKTPENIGGLNYCGSSASADANDQVQEMGQNITFQNAKVTVEAKAGPELQLTEAGETAGGVISTAYGIGDGYDGVVMGLALTTPAGYIEIDTSKSGGAETTGAEIKLYNDGGELQATYVFIYFGDVNMDGMVDSSDATLIEEYEFFVAEINEEFRLLAADVNGDMSPDSSDATAIEEFEFFVIESLMAQSEVAAVYAV